MNPILAVAIGIFMPMLFGFSLGRLLGRQEMSKEIIKLCINDNGKNKSIEWGESYVSGKVKMPTTTPVPSIPCEHCGEVNHCVHRTQ